MKKVIIFVCLIILSFGLGLLYKESVKQKNISYKINTTILNIKEVPSNIFTSPGAFNPRFPEKYLRPSYLLTTNSGEFYITYIGTNKCLNKIKDFKVKEDVTLTLRSSLSKGSKPNVIKINKYNE